MALYPELPADVLAGRSIQRARVPHLLRHYRRSGMVPVATRSIRSIKNAPRQSRGGEEEIGYGLIFHARRGRFNPLLPEPAFGTTGAAWDNPHLPAGKSSAAQAARSGGGVEQSQRRGLP